ncbi:protease modulator HflK [Novosphingobium sp. PhB165]|uniref:protease modulator HflK n=1 Tax=Novosphingobium sp. PhB165 TaxID=2485105 RepID=UPI001047D743|nr:protease modulator HflK [Novosphingobium sp. PhB165]
MTGRKSPWGSGGDGGDDGDGPPRTGPLAGPQSGNEGDAPSGGDGEPESGEGRQEPGTTPPGPSTPGTSAPEGKGAPGEPRGPRNPWLPSGGTPPRRSASIEDIFRPRDPRRTSGGGNGGGLGGLPNLPRRSDGKSWLPLGIGIAVLGLLGVSSVHVLGPTEQGVVTRVGQFSRVIDHGFSLTLPWPIEQVEKTDVRSFSVDQIPDGEGEKLMLTADKNLVDLSYQVRWNIKDLKDYSFRLTDPKDTVREVAEAAMRASIGQISLNDALSGAGRARVEQDVRDRTQRILDYYRAGVAIQGVEIKKADPPSKTRAAFDQVNVAQQEADRDRSNARASAQQVIARAQGDAAQFDKVYEEYKLAPEVTRRRMYYETMERVISDNDTIVAEPKNMNSFLSLPEMKRRADPAAGDITVTAGPTASATQGGQ